MANNRKVLPPKLQSGLGEKKLGFIHEQLKNAGRSVDIDALLSAQDYSPHELFYLLKLNENTQYDRYCAHLKVRLTEIVGNYKTKLAADENQKLKINNDGYFYDGAYPNQEYLIALVQRLALINQDYLDQLAVELAGYNDFKHEEQLAFLENLYKTFKILAKKGYDLSQLKALKEDIHHLAQVWGLPCKIINTEKYPRFVTLPDGTKKRVIEDHYIVAKDGDPRIKYLISANQQSDRYRKKKATWWADLFSTLIGTSEGAVSAKSLFLFLATVVAGGATLTLATVFTALTWPVLLTFGVVAVVSGVAGAYCNKYLFNGDLYDTFKELFIFKTIMDPIDPSKTKRVRRLWLNHKSKEISTGLKWAAVIIGGMSIATGAVYACLTFNTIFALVGATLAPLAAVSAPWVLMGIASIAAGIYAMATFWGITALLWAGISDAIKNADKISAYWHKHFVDKETRNIALGLVKGLAVIGTIAVVTLATLFLMTEESRGFFGFVSGNKSGEGLGTAAKAISWVLSSIDGFVHTGFGVKGLLGPLDVLVERIKGKKGKDADVKPTLNNLQQAKEDQFNRDMVKSLVAATFNGLGQSALVAGAVIAAAALFGMPFLAAPAFVITVAVLKFFYSGGPNWFAFYKAKKAGMVSMEPPAPPADPVEKDMSHAQIRKLAGIRSNCEIHYLIDHERQVKQANVADEKQDYFDNQNDFGIADQPVYDLGRSFRQ